MIRIETQAGHGGGKPTAKIIEEITDEWAFMFYNMGINPTKSNPLKLALIISIIILTPFIVITLFRKFKVAKNIGTVIMAFTVGILLSFLFSFSNFFTIEETKSLNGILDLLMQISVPLAIPLMLFSSDFKLWAKSLPKAVIALCTGVAAVVVAIIATFLIFKNYEIPTLAQLCAMMSGFYTGGNVNFFAISRMIEPKPAETLITLTYTSEMVVVFPFLIFLTAGGYKFFRWVLPHKDINVVKDTNNPNDTTLKDVENYDGMFTKKVFPKTMLGLLLSLGFMAVGAGLSLLITGKLSELVVILTITTLAIAFSFHNKVRALPRTFELGMFFILIFSVIVASKFDITMLNANAMKIFLFVLSITFLSITLHCILCRIFKVSGDLFAVAIVALICSPPFVPPVVAAMGNRKVLISGITIGLVGYAIGNYLGIGLFYLLSLL